ncbi:MAG TPA: c-type cytochrome [Polyangiaceae bacterium]|nr:c-type cytochrome [Polyangiaceae bacterium]
MDMQNLGVAIVLSSLALVTACGSDSDGNKPTETTATTFEQQVSSGATEYGEHCAKCHGSSGEGTAQGPAVVGPTALPLDPPSGAMVRKTRFVTVADVAQFVVKNMPGDAPTTLSTEEYYSILAFDLHANGIDLDKKLDGTVAASLVIPRD